MIPEGLPNLASLQIDQKGSSDPEVTNNHEGSLWYESLDGEFHEEEATTERTARLFTDDYIHSIVKGAPNLKELCLHGEPLDVSTVVCLLS